MADSNITGLSAAATIAGTEVLPVDQSGATVKVTVANLAPGLPAVVGDSGSGGTKGLVPAPGSGDAAAGKFLKADGTFAVPSGLSTLTTKGDILTRDSSALARLAVGSNGQVLTADSAQTTGVKWAAVGGGRTLFSSTTLGTAASTITVSGLPSTAGKDLVISYVGRGTGSVTSVGSRILFNGDTTSGNYSSEQFLNGNSSSATAGTEAATSAGVNIITDTGISGNANAVAEAEITVRNYAGTTFQKIVRSVTSNTLPQNVVRSAVWKSAAAISSFTLTSGATSFDVGTTVNVFIDG